MELEEEASNALKRVRDRIDEIYRKRIAKLPRNARKPLKMQTLGKTNQFWPKSEPKEKQAIHRASFKTENPKPTAIQPKMVLRFQFQEASKLFFAEGNRGEMELGVRTHRMRNGLSLTFSASTLELRGDPFNESHFRILTVGSPINFSIGANSVTINHEYVLSKFGVTKNENMYGSARPAEHTMTLMGPEQKMIRATVNKKPFVIFVGPTGIAVTGVIE